MARRKSDVAQPTLFPFLSVLAAVIGTLILIITGMSQIALAKPKQRVEIDRFDPGKKNPVYVECRKEGLRIHPDDPSKGEPVLVARHEIAGEDGAWRALQSRLAHDPNRYLLLLVRPDGVGAFTDARAAMAGSDIEIGYEPLFGDGDVRFHPRATRP